MSTRKYVAPNEDGEKLFIVEWRPLSRSQAGAVGVPYSVWASTPACASHQVTRCLPNIQVTNVRRALVTEDDR